MARVLKVDRARRIAMVDQRNKSQHGGTLLERVRQEGGEQFLLGVKFEKLKFTLFVLKLFSFQFETFSFETFPPPVVCFRKVLVMTRTCGVDARNQALDGGLLDIRPRVSHPLASGRRARRSQRGTRQGGAIKVPP